jgi:hypothetical protein
MDNGQWTVDDCIALSTHRLRHAQASFPTSHTVLFYGVNLVSSGVRDSDYHEMETGEVLAFDFFRVRCWFRGFGEDAQWPRLFGTQILVGRAKNMVDFTAIFNTPAP